MICFELLSMIYVVFWRVLTLLAYELNGYFLTQIGVLSCFRIPLHVCTRIFHPRYVLERIYCLPDVCPYLLNLTWRVLTRIYYFLTCSDAHLLFSDVLWCAVILMWSVWMCIYWFVTCIWWYPTYSHAHQWWTTP